MSEDNQSLKLENADPRLLLTNIEQSTAKIVGYKEKLSRMVKDGTSIVEIIGYEEMVCYRAAHIASLCRTLSKLDLEDDSPEYFVRRLREVAKKVRIKKNKKFLIPLFGLIKQLEE